MSRSGKSLLQVVAALALALVAGLLVFRWMDANQAQAVPTQPAVETVDVVVSAADLPRGTKLAATDLKTVPYMEGSLPARSFTVAEQLVGRVLTTPLAANEPVTEVRLAPTDVHMGGVSSMIRPGHRAMTVKGNKVMGLAGFIRPGNRVDVLVTLLTGERMDKPVTKLVLANKLVLATGEELEPSVDGGQSMPVDTYTLELTPEESEMLALAANQGTLNFALRNESDTEDVFTSGADVESALAANRPAAAPKPKAVAKPRPKAEPKPTVVVEVINGAERQNMEF